MQRLFPALWVVLFLVVSPLHAEPKVYGEQRIHRWWDAVTDDIAQTWEQPDRYDLYLPFLSWHARFMYDKEKTDNYNEMPWAGAGRVPLQRRGQLERALCHDVQRFT